MQTVHEEGFQVEQSADNFITTVPAGVELCRRIGLGGELIGTNPEHRRTFVVRGGRLCRLPDGFLMMAPTRMWPLAVTPILSPLGKLRAAMEYFIPPRTDGGDESMAAFVRRRLGREVFERLVEPLVSAVYAADVEKLSVEATLAQFREMELEHGSLIRAMRRRMKDRPKAAANAPAIRRRPLQPVRHPPRRTGEHDRADRRALAAGGGPPGLPGPTDRPPRGRPLDGGVGRGGGSVGLACGKSVNECEGREVFDSTADPGHAQL